MSVGEVSVKFDILLDDDFVSCVLEDFPNSGLLSLILCHFPPYMCCRLTHGQ